MIAPVAIAGILIMAILANQTFAAQESSNSGNTSQGANNTGPATPNQVTTTTQQLLPALHHPTPIVTTTHHNIVTATSKQLSSNGILPKPTLAPKPTGLEFKSVLDRCLQGAKTTAERVRIKLYGSCILPKPTVAPRVQGAVTIAEAQQLKKAEEDALRTHQELMRIGIQFDPKKMRCEGTITRDSYENNFCINGKVVPRPNPEAPNAPSFGLPSRNK
jgi:hypothetical protein